MENRSRGVVLLADDEENVRVIGKRMIERLGFSVVTAADGIEALELFKKNKKDVACILLDIAMPRMDGGEAYRQIREIDTKVPILLCSGYDEEEVFQRCPEVQENGFLRKPYKVSKLAEMLNDMVH